MKNVHVSVLAVSTFGCFTLSNEKSAPGIATRKQLPLCVLSTQFTKIPAAGEEKSNDEV